MEYLKFNRLIIFNILLCKKTEHIFWYSMILYGKIR